MRPGLLSAGDGARPPATVEAGDLRLDGMWAAMARGDEDVLGSVRAVTLAPLTDPAAIAHRQEVLGDCMANAAVVRSLHALAGRAVAAERKIFRGVTTTRPEALLSRSVRVLEQSLDQLRRLRDLASQHGHAFRSPGFTRLFARVRAELDEEYLTGTAALLGELGFEHGLLAEARLGPGNTSVGFRLHRPLGRRRDPSVRRVRRAGLTFTVPSDNEETWRALPAFRDLMLAEVARAASGSADHVRDFFRALRDELGFYVGCLNLAETLTGLGVPTCVPGIGPELTARNLHEPALALLRAGTVGNDLDAGAAALIMVTGTNRGGKSTFLRAVGLAQLMTQCGMFVAADRFTAPIAHGILTHFRREEDRSMSSGRLDEELARMSAAVDRLGPGSLLLCNESFASTTEREASGIAAEIIRALTDLGVRIVFVTHLYELARRLHAEAGGGQVFLTTERDADGEPTFRIVPGAPSPTAHAEDLYLRVFGEDG
ncbi:MutS-related protein [Spirillospora sp. CA-294931]|uniref:MutS-related protein n=1 Tax=Spirillospora sp. CA-294931 TaxID=3240042 RepID=UPI003D8E34B2